MGLDEELDTIEDGAETEAEQIDQETELEDVEEFQDDEEFDPQDEETDLEEAYEGFFAEEGPDGEGETSPVGDGGLATLVEDRTGFDLSEEGFHIVDGDREAAEDELYEKGSLDTYDADALDEDGDVTAGAVSEITEANALEELEDGQADDVQDVTIIEPSAEDDGYELVELELDDDDIVRYIEDEDGDVIGFVLEEDGEEVEYFYVEEEEGEASDDDNEFDFGITKEGVAAATSDMNAIYKDGIAVAAELKGAFDDIKSAFDFTSILKK